MTISPWDDKAEIKSPNGRITATILETWEVGMGAPKSGELRLSNGMTRNSCNPSMVWSSDSEFLAVPQWTKDRNQRLMIISISRRASRYASGQYRVLQLESFENGIVRGIDSPVHMPRKIAVDVASMDWADFSRTGKEENL